MRSWTQSRTQGVIGDLTKVQALLSVAKQYVITDAGWNLLDFASQMQRLTGGNLVFHTLPIEGYATIDGQDGQAGRPGRSSHRGADVLPAPVTPSRRPGPGPGHRYPGRADLVDVFNGGGTPGLASAVLRGHR